MANKFTAQGTYQEMLDYSKSSGQAGSISLAATPTFGRARVYGFTPTGGVGASSGGAGKAYQDLTADFEKREAEARKANVAREKEIRGIYGGIIKQGQGAARVAGMADIERTKTKAIGAGTQHMISSGLYGTTTAAAIPVQAEAQAGQARLKLEDMLQQRTNQAKLGLAGFAERIETPYPDYNMLMQAMIAQGSR